MDNTHFVTLEILLHEDRMNVYDCNLTTWVICSNICLNVTTFDSYVAIHGSPIATYVSNVATFDLYVVFGSFVATYASYGQILLHKGDMLQHLRHL
ncbi:hypothetical protein H5410_002257 [Solanum commersonii]|uniref:Uncharacterized protein n=1 Tax=Solanum commersonii TaxID=4109 RepID=A0A9J6B1K8_SOLCO|nr:hypothetical protein H5410_002257 [Solanum commersonii]